MKKEKQFEKELARLAPLFGCYYAKIEDTRSINSGNRGFHREVKRICDSVIITPTNNWLCECKIDYGKLKPHQEKLRDVTYSHNGLFVVLRKVKLKSCIEYRIITKFGEFKTTMIGDIFRILQSLPN